MNLRDLSTDAMLAITDELLQKPTHGHHEPTPREVLLAQPKLAPHVPDLEAVHAGLLAQTTTAPTGDAAKLAELRARQDALDITHDRAVRSGYALATLGATAASQGEAPDAALLELRDTLFPSGLSAVNESYTAESGAALAQEKRVTAAVRKRLERVVLEVDGQRFSLADFVNEQVRAGKELGKLETRKQRLQSNAQNLVDSEGATESFSALSAARTAWIQQLQLFVMLVQRTKLTDAERVLLLAKLTAEVDKLPRRAPKAPAPEASPSGGTSK